jgi:glycosyltransferase involved in cell wall biosynthesis
MPDMKPAVSIITPTKNRCALLRETMDSVQRQTLGDWEHLVVDDGSDDGTAQEVLERAQKDPRVRYLLRTKGTAGANVCRNQGLAAANADLVVFLDSDDLIEPECLARRVAIMDRNKDIDFAVSRMGAFLKAPGDLRHEQSADLLGDDLLGFLFFEVPWQTTGPTWRREALLRLGGFDESLLSWQDVDLHIRAIAGGLRYLRFPQVDYHMRWQEDPAKVSIQQRRLPQHLEAAETLLMKFERVVREGPGMTWMRQRALCSLYFFLAERWIDAGRLSEALRCWALIRDRKLGSRLLHGAGAGLLILQAMGARGHRLGRRIGHKWKGWVRMRTEPELVPR